jgi:ABC-type Na+ efflux pump permease subunit
MKIHIRSIFLLLCFFLLFAPLTVWAQTATISGKVIDKGIGIGLPGASVVIDGTTTGAMTDMDGNFKISSVQPGTVVIKVSYVGYVTETSSPLTISAGEEKSISFSMSENVKQLQETQVVARKTTNTENAVMMDVKKSEQIVNGVSSQQISKSQDRTAAEVIRRLPGVTMMDNGFVNIRGLNERYNLTMLNGILA